MFRQAISGILAAIIILALCVPATAWGAGKGDTVLETIPADVLFCVRVKNLEYTASMVDQFLVGVSPMPLATSVIVRTQLAQMLGNPELAGVNMAGSFAVFATAEPNQTVPDIYALIPITDYSRVTDVNTNVPKPDANGVSTIMLNGKPFVCITKVGGYGLLSRDYDKTLRMGKSLSAANTQTLSAALGLVEVKQADGDLIWAYGNIQKAAKIYGPMLFDQMEQLKKTMQKQAEPNKPGTPMDPAFAIDGYSRLLKMLLDEGKSLTIATSPKPDLLLLKTTFKALPGTEMAGMLTAEAATKRKGDLGGYLEDGAVMNAIAWTNHGSMRKMSAKIIDLIAQTVGREPNAADVVKIKKLSAELVDSIGEEYVCSMSGDPNAKPPFDARYFLEIKDVNQFNRATDELVKAWAGSVFDDFYKKMGMKTAFTITRGVDNYGGVTIDAATFDMKWGDWNSPEMQMINAMYGGGMSYRWAIVNGLWVCKISSDPNAIYKLIDQAKAGPPATMCSEIQKAMAIIPDANNEDIIGTYNYLRLFKMMGAMLPVPLPQMNIVSKSNLVFAAKVRSGSVTVDIGVPKEHLVEIMTMVQMMMQQQMQQKMQQQQPMTAPPPMTPQPAPLSPPKQPGE